MPTLGNGVAIDETIWNSPNYTAVSSVPSVYGQAHKVYWCHYSSLGE